MPETPETQQDEEEYWQSARAFVRVIISDLNEQLKTARISRKKRRSICESYAFSIGSLFDQTWIRANRRTVYPMLCFSKRFLDADTPLDSIFPLTIPHKSVELHAMVSDEVNWFFDECGERLPPNYVGEIGSEVSDSDVPELDDDKPEPVPCHVCQGTGHCYCIRKGPGTPDGCSRCAGTGTCRICRDRGTARPRRRFPEQCE